MQTIEQLRRADRQRSNLPGEHWLTFAVGLGLWVATRKHPSPLLRLLAGLGAGLLAARALSGRDVPATFERLVPHAD